MLINLRRNTTYNKLLTLIPTPIGNLEDISFRALNALKEADLFLCEDTRVTKKLLMLLEKKHVINFSNKRFISVHAHNEKRFLDSLEEDFFEQKVVYLSDAGMPGISDPAQEIIAYCHEKKISIDALPGANAALMAFVLSGFVQTRFLFFGFLPHKGKERNQNLEEALYSGYTTIMYEAPHRLLKLLEELSKKEPLREVFLAKELTKLHQKLYKGSAKELYQDFKKENIKGEWCVVLNAGEQQKSTSALSKEDIINLDLPKKTLAKLLAKLLDKPVKECYNDLLTNN